MNARSNRDYMHSDVDAEANNSDVEHVDTRDTSSVNAGESGSEIECVDIRDTASVSCDRDTSGDWNDIKSYILTGRYPSSISQSKRRNFRKKALKFVVHKDRLFFKKRGCLRAVLCTEEQQKQFFQVRLD